jgi:hypothetical protein
MFGEIKKAAPEDAASTPLIKPLSDVTANVHAAI